MEFLHLGACLMDHLDAMMLFIAHNEMLSQNWRAAKMTHAFPAATAAMPTTGQRIFP